MADIDVERGDGSLPQEGYTVGELVFWIVGILMIPVVPIVMILFLTPHSGM
jgi:hypothetical protein